MKVYITVDMEGVGGVTGSYQIRQDPGALLEARQQATREVNAAIEGALKAGATTIYVNENHSGRDLILSELHPEAQAIVGKPKPLITMEGLDDSFTALFLIGLHAMAGTLGAIMDHTWVPKTVYAVRVNRIPIGEIGLNAALAGYYGVPIALVSGDDKAVAEAKALLGDVEGVIVKYGVDRFAARCLHPQRVQAALRESAKRALIKKERFKPFILEPPLTMEIDWQKAIHAVHTAQIPGTTQVSARTVSFSANDFRQVTNWFIVANRVAKSVEDPIY